ncbi:MAG: leucine-rich repeat domain-containing protein [Muribaculaceae bacterium]|nr:leucine-rich repeat domain-containing protein [Muribaculaceae bacterium]
MPDYAFYNTKIKQINITPTVVSIGKSAFEGCERLHRISIPASVKEIEESAFVDCRYLWSVDIESLESRLNIYFHNASANPIAGSKRFTVKDQSVETRGCASGN